MALAGPLAAQEDSDIIEFMAAGKKAYEKGDLAGAAVEFENVLMLDERNFDAKVWLAQIYVDKKQVDKARKLLAELQRMAPGHARVAALAKLIGTDEGLHAIATETDLVVYEALTLLGSGTRQRPFGLVVPEGKVGKPKPGAASDTEVDLSLLDTPGPGDGGAASSAALTAILADQGPLGEVFDILAEEGLNPALDKYFDLAVKDRSLVALDDKGLLRKGMETFQPAVSRNPKDLEARYYLGMILFLNGLLEDARQTLDPLRKEANPFQDRLRPVLAELDKKKAEEEARLAAIQKEKEALEAARPAEQARREAASIAANLSSSSASGTGPLNPSDVLHNEGYELYKKGLLDPAIEKFQAAIAQNDKDPKYFYHMGLALTDKGLAGNVDSFDRAMEAFNKVIALEPGGKLAKDSEVMIRDIVAAKKSLKN